MLKVVSHPSCLRHDVPGSKAGPHVERPDRIPAARQGLEALKATFVEARPVDRDSLLRVHTTDHVRRVEAACDRGEWLDSDTYARPESWEASRAAGGAAIDTARLTADGDPAFSLARPPGHHATRSRAMGFCLFSNVALAADALAREGRRVAIVDVDVHHGNGTQDVFYERDDVLFVSLHQSPFYPGTGHAHEIGRGPGEGYTVNLPVPSGTGHAGWLELVDRVVVPVVEAFSPDVILVSAGFDAHREDPIGGLDLVADTFYEAVAGLREIAATGAVLEGGYSLEALEVCARSVGAALIWEANPVKETITEGVRPWGMLRSEVESYHAGRWPVRLGG